MLARLVDLPATFEAPAPLPFDPGAVDVLQPIVTALRGFMQGADGLEAAWIGKGPGTIVRLAGLLGLIDWATEPRGEPPGSVTASHVERAHVLWAGYFWPHAQAVFGQAQESRGWIEVPPPPRGMGQVVFFRAKSLGGFGQWFNVREDGQALGKLTNGAYFVVILPPGEHSFSATSDASASSNCRS